jgi:hypothetical protein
MRIYSLSCTSSKESGWSQSVVGEKLTKKPNAGNANRIMGTREVGRERRSDPSIYGPRRGLRAFGRDWGTRAPAG